MNALRWIADRWFRLDARALGLFRILLGLTLIADWVGRWSWRIAFYTNEGVLPNHNHLFQLGDRAHVWSLFHAFSNGDEMIVALLFVLAFYVLFTVGLYTRVMTAVCAVCMVSLAGRNVLMDSVGDAVAITMLLLAMFLPLGARYSLDALRRSFADFDEHGPADLNDRRHPVPGRARPSVAALALLLAATGVPLSAALQQKGATWTDGSALRYALGSDRWITGLGEWARTLSPGALAGWTKLLHGAELFALPLALVPVARRVTRPVAMAAQAVVALSYGLFFELGAYGGALLAGAALLAPAELWDARQPKNRPIKLYYDEDCGICLWLARLLKRLDTRHNVTFVGNSDAEALPDGISAETANESMIAVDPEGAPHTDAEALAQVLRSLSGLGWLGVLIGVPGVKQLVAWLYYRVATNRLAISQALGLGACGVVRPDVEEPHDDGADAAVEDASVPARRWRMAAIVLMETALVAGVGAMALAGPGYGSPDGAAPNDVALDPKPPDGPITGPRPPLTYRQMVGVAASYARISGRWGPWAPDPPQRNETVVTDATVRDDGSIDVLTGYTPDLDLQQPARHRLGSLWASYFEAVHREENSGYRQELRRYLTRGGPVTDATPERPLILNRLEVYWVSAPIAEPGKPADGEVQRTDIFDPAAGLRQFQPDFGDPNRSRLRHFRPMR